MTLSCVWVLLWTEFGFIEHLQIVTTSNCSVIPNSHNIQFSTARIKSSQSAVSSPVDVPLLPGSRPRRLATISHQFSTPLTAVSRVPCNQSQSHIATDGQSVSKSWCRAPFGAYDQIFSYYYLTVSVLFFFVGRPLWREDGSVFCQSHCLH
jgi:hypothetical protein